MGAETQNSTENSNSIAILERAIERRLENERCTIYAGGRKELAKKYLIVVQLIATKLDSEVVGLGSVFNNIGNETKTQKASDIDFSIVPNSDPIATSKKLKKFLKTLPGMTKRKHDVDVEAGRQYTAYNISGDGRIALVVSTDEKSVPVLGSLRLVDMNMKGTWTTNLTEGNPTKNSPIIEIGFPPHDENTKTWLDPKTYDPTQAYVGILKDGKLQIEKCDHSGIEEIFPKLTQKSQAILSLRLFAKDQKIQRGLSLTDFNTVVPNLYTFRYNIEPSFNKMDISTLINALTNEEFMDRVIKYTFPYIYKVMMSFNRPYEYLSELFNTIKSENLHLNPTKLISIAVQKEIVLQNPKSGKQIDLAAKMGRIVEKNIFDYVENIIAFEEISKKN